MYRTYCVLVLLSLYAGMAYSFSWDIVTSADGSNRLDFYDIDGTLTHTENITSPIFHIIYDPVHDRVLYTDLRNIYSFEITTKKKECLIKDMSKMITDLAYDPATELLFWTEYFESLYSISLKPGLNNNKVNEKQLIMWDENMLIVKMAVDSCGGFLYYSKILPSNMSVSQFERARFDGSQREILQIAFYDIVRIMLFDPDQKSHKLYWVEPGTSEYIFKYSDLNGQNIRTIHKLVSKPMTYEMTASKEFIYLRIITDINDRSSRIWKIPKNPPHDFDIESQLFIEGHEISEIATKYSIEDITRGHQNCDALKSLLPNNSVSTDVTLLCVHGTKVSGDSRCECTQGYGGERCNYKISECHNYCVQGDCSVSAEGQPICSCNAGYSGERCEVNECQGYCLNDGNCSLSEDSKLVCQCTGGHEGDRCEIPVFITKLADPTDVVLSKAIGLWQSYKLIFSGQVLVMALRRYKVHVSC